MPRKESEAVPKGNGPFPRQEEFGLDQPTLADVHRMLRNDSINLIDTGRAISINRRRSFTF